MFFIKVGSAISWLFVVYGLFRAIISSLIAFGFITGVKSSRYFGSGTAGEHIDEGFMIFFAGIVLGLLVKIANSLHILEEK